MKKLYLVIFTLCFSMGSTAQIFFKDLDFGQTSNRAMSIPKDFSYENIPLLQTWDNDGVLSIYDENLNLKESIKIDDEKSFDYQITYQDEVRDVESVAIKKEIEECLNQSYDEFINQQKLMSPTFNESKLKITEESNGDKLIVYNLSEEDLMYVSYDQYYYGYSVFGAKYPRIYFRCKNDIMYRYQATYKITYGEWRIVGSRTVDQHYTYRGMHISHINLNQSEGKASSYFVVSQTLFNNDEAFEYLVPKIVLSSQGTSQGEEVTPEVISGGDDPIETTRSTIISEKSRVAMAGFQVLSSDGTVVRDLDFDSGFEFGTILSYVNLITIGNKTYLAFNGYQDGKRCTIFYQIDRQTSEIKKARTTRGSFMVSPTVVDSSTPVYISFSDDNKSGSDIIVYSASGSQLQQQSVPSGEKSTQLTVSRNPGMYIVARKQQGQPVQTQKIIIK